MRLTTDKLVEATAKVMIAELRIAEGGRTPQLLEELEVAQGAVDTIRELLVAIGEEIPDKKRLDELAVRLAVVKTGMTPYEIASIVEQEKEPEPIQRIKDNIIARKSPQRLAPTASAWDKARAEFDFFCRDALEIVYRPGLNEDYPLGGYGAFKVNEHQLKFIAVLIDMWLSGVPVRIILLKARQLGMTTILLAFWAWLMIQTEDFTVFFMIDKDPHMYEKRDMMLRWFANIEEKYPEAPKVERQGGKRIVLSNRAKILFESAYSPNPGTSEMVHAIHLSEKPKWPKGRAKLVDKSLLPGMPTAPGTFIVDESTAQGTGEFYKKWTRVMRGDESGDTKTTPIFLQWFLSPEYTSAPSPSDYDVNGKFIFLNNDREVCETDEYGNIELTEEAYARKYALSDAQILWRRNRIKNEYKGSRLDFDQEYPTTPDHAWAAFGRLFFGSKCVLDIQEYLQEPIVIGNVVDSNGNNDTTRLFSWTKYVPAVQPDRTGNFKIYERPIVGERYYVPGDAAEGKEVEKDGKQEPDFSVLPVLRSDGKLVALLRGRIKPEDLAWHAVLIAVLYNNATVNIERNAVGEAVWVMFKQTGYNRIFIRDGHGSYEDRAWNKVTAANRKSMLIEMRQHLRMHPDHVVDEDFAHEIATFVTNSEGKPEAMSGEHDDIVMAYMHGWHMIYDITGVRIIIKEPAEPEPDEHEFYNVLKFNGIDLSYVEPEIYDQWD